MGGCLGLLFVNSQAYRYGLALVAPEIGVELGLSPAALGTIASANFLAFAIMQVPAGILVDRFGARRIIAGMQVLTLAGTVVFAFARSAEALFVGAALMGVGASANFIGGLVVFARWVSPAAFGSATGVMVAIGGLGHLVSASPIAYLFDAVGWRDGYLMLGAIAATAALLVWAVVRDAPPGARVRGARTPERLAASVLGLVRVLAAPGMPGLLLLVGLGGGTIFSLRGLWVGPYLNDVHGLDPVGRGHVLLVMSVAMIVGSLGFGPADRRLGARRALLLGSAGLIAAAFALLTLAPGAALWQVTLLLIVLGAVGAYDVVVYAEVRARVPEHMTARGITAVNLALFGGAAALQLLSGHVVELAGTLAPGTPTQAYRAVFGFLFLAVLAGMLAYARTPRRTS